MIAFSGTTHSIVCHIALLYGGPRSKFRRNRNAAHHATAAATTSWTKASPIRVLILAGMGRAGARRPAPVDRAAIAAERDEDGDEKERPRFRQPASGRDRRHGAEHHPRE